jgi:hypothetical protein
VVLLAADGVSNTAIAELVGLSRPKVIAWRQRYERSGIGGLADAQRSGRPREIDHAAFVSATLKPPPKKLGVTHWSSRLLAARLGIGNATVARAWRDYGVQPWWRDYGVQPWRVETFKFSTDPELVAKVTDVVGLYLAPPENAIVLAVDEKSRIQGLDRTQKMLPMQPGFPERRTHDYVRHGTSTLFAALEIATGKVTGACKKVVEEGAQVGSCRGRRAHTHTWWCPRRAGRPRHRLSHVFGSGVPSSRRPPNAGSAAHRIEPRHRQRAGRTRTSDAH